jgi:hypothetical protein
LSELKLSKIIDGFSLESYYAGVNMAFAEVVGAGCKRLALSNPYTEEMAQRMLKLINLITEEYGVKVMMEPNLIITKLFPADIAKDKIVVMIAQNEEVLDEYMELKQMKANSDKAGNPENLEKEIARRFGHLLSYSDTKINQLMKD